MSGLFQSNALVWHQYDHALREIRDALAQMPDSRILANSDEELTDYFYEQWKLDPIEEDPNRDAQATESRQIREGVEIQYAVIELPLVPKPSNKVGLQLRGQTFRMSDVAQMGSFREHDQMVVLRLPLDYSERLLADLRTMFGQINEDIERHAPDFRPRILQAVKARRERVTAQISKFEDTMAKIGVSIHKKPDAVEPINVSVRREIKLLRERPSQRAQSDLDPKSLRLVIDLIDQSGKGFETTPSAFASLGEEQLRDVILGYLNAVFGLAAATGEAFSKSGKTDILLRVRDGVVLIAECKFWAGAQKYGETIDQLFGYLTWRHTYGIVITFSKNKGLTGVVRTANDAIANHGTYRSRLGALGDTHLRSTHSHPDDDDKTVEVHHLFYNLYVGGGKGGSG